MKLNRNDLRIVIGTITRHCHINRNLFNIDITDNPLYRGCMEEQKTIGVEQRAHILKNVKTVKKASKNISRLLNFLIP